MGPIYIGGVVVRMRYNNSLEAAEGFDLSMLEIRQRLHELKLMAAHTFSIVSSSRYVIKSQSTLPCSVFNNSARWPMPNLPN